MNASATYRFGNHAASDLVVGGVIAVFFLFFIYQQKYKHKEVSCLQSIDIKGSEGVYSHRFPPLPITQYKEMAPGTPYDVQTYS